MSNKTLEGMARAFDATSLDYHGQEPSAWVDQADVDGMKAALLWLANNVDARMVDAYDQDFYETQHELLGSTEDEQYLWRRKSAISAALRAAAGGGEK